MPHVMSILYHNEAMQCSNAALVYHTDPLGVYHTQRVCIMNEYSSGELLSRAAFMHHEDKNIICCPYKVIYTVPY